MENASATTTVEKGTTVAYVIVVNQQSASQKVLVDRLGGHALLAKTLFLFSPHCLTYRRTEWKGEQTVNSTFISNRSMQRERSAR